MSNHGNAFNYTLGQFTEVLYSISKSLTKVLRGFDPRAVLAALTKNPELLEHALTVALSSVLGNVGPSVPLKSPFPTWKTIRVGKYHTVEAVLAALVKVGCYRSFGADQAVINNKAFRLSVEETGVELVCVSARDLGFKQRTSRERIFKRAIIVHGLGLCTAEDGLYLREQYLDQPAKDAVLIGMQLEAGQNGLSVERPGNDLWLEYYDGHPLYEWDVDQKWVFRAS